MTTDADRERLRKLKGNLTLTHGEEQWLIKQLEAAWERESRMIGDMKGTTGWLLHPDTRPREWEGMAAQSLLGWQEAHDD